MICSVWKNSFRTWGTNMVPHRQRDGVKICVRDQNMAFQSRAESNQFYLCFSFSGADVQNFQALFKHQILLPTTMRVSFFSVTKRDNSWTNLQNSTIFVLFPGYNCYTVSYSFHPFPAWKEHSWSVWMYQGLSTKSKGQFILLKTFTHDPTGLPFAKKDSCPQTLLQLNMRP